MSKREIVSIDEDKCDGCGQCIPNCHEGALKVIDGKARLVSDLFCDGLGACIGHCPHGAIKIEKREARPYDERRVMRDIAKKGQATIKAHLLHLKEHGADELYETGLSYLREKNIPIPDGVEGEKLACGCSGSQVKTIEPCGCSGGGEESDEPCGCESPAPRRGKSMLRTWPVQIHLVPPHAPYLKGADLLVCADCVPFAYPNFHDDFIRGRVVLVGCPKLDDAGAYVDKLADIFSQNDINSLTVVHMEVPCCFGMVKVVKAAMAKSGKNITFDDITITTKGEVLEG
jgi:NAD-dependent dihydropyrimidine dehydrogenase PreA subunit